MPSFVLLNQNTTYALHDVSILVIFTHSTDTAPPLTNRKIFSLAKTHIKEYRDIYWSYHELIWLSLLIDFPYGF